MPVADRSSPQRDVGFYFALAQTGLEMVAPIAVGVFLDNRFGWSPWATTAGAVLGMVGGLTHMLWMLKRQEDRQRTQPPRDST